ncbi:tRNA-(MS[2]IO[6]A)-hydroxylase (MiaE)-like [Microlunatus sagamiharensis]|uniref:tRNA-(MS[2]IO[6]A)-hydroxylase (MiaE)-like n=1 Tax=Microlunatus sagamiharensis TaxID=546874 RepID=A0A1H2MD57_9ACTN|nr:ferritin-like fold-containing protein [Microlunatus sagamiharensis]SDU91119.1 tRNA-(MS[2]IO[6]A)-hydroxylase (MiaE)-like [Microlunatus sagamiharensis]
MSDAAADARPEPTAGTVDLLGAIAYGALTAFERLAQDGAGAPTLADKVTLATMAGRQVDHLERVRDRLAELGADVMSAMAPFHRAFDDFHAHTRPKDWLEGLMWVYVGSGFADDFYAEVAQQVDDTTRALVEDVLSDAGHEDFVVEHVRAGIDADPRVAGRLALWGRRLVGEALSQAQRVAMEREGLTSLLMGDGGVDVVAVNRSFSRLIEHHAARMRRLGLQP